MYHIFCDGETRITHMIVVVTVYSMGLSFLHVSAHVCAANTLTHTRKSNKHSLPMFVRSSEPLRRMMNVVVKNCAKKSDVEPNINQI